MRSDAAGHGVQVGRYVGQPTILNLGVVSANTQLIEYKTYRLWSSVDCFFVYGTTAGITATISSHPLKAGIDALHATDATNVFLAGIVASGTGVLFISELDVNSA